MPRAIWKGAISFGLVTVPVGLYTATERAAEIHFRLLHAKDASPVDYKRVCEAEGVEVAWSEITRGYEYTKGQYVIVTDKDFAKARVEATQTFAIRDFVPARAIDVRYFDEPYYLAPAGKPAAKAYALLREALAHTERVGIGTIVLRQREPLAALAPTGPALVLSTLRYAHEIRRPRYARPPRRRPRRRQARAGAGPPAHRHARHRLGPGALPRHLSRRAAEGDRAEGQGRAHLRPRPAQAHPRREPDGRAPAEPEGTAPGAGQGGGAPSRHAEAGGVTGNRCDYSIRSIGLRTASSSLRVVRPSKRARITPSASTTNVHGSERRFHSSTVGEIVSMPPACQISW